MSSPEPEPPSGSSLVARAGWALKDTFLGRGDEARTSDAVKLVHADDLHRWERFPRCQEFDGITFGQYRSEAYQLERRRRTVSSLIDAVGELARIDSDDVVEYHSDHVDIPRRGLSGRPVRLPLPEEPRPGAWVESSAGRLDGGSLVVEPRWRSGWAHLTYKGPSRLVKAERIAELERLLGSMSEEQRRTVEEVAASRYAQPVLFVSHRWEDDAHPDPTGAQLRKLRELKDCFLVYDYSSFPQRPRSAEAQADFEQILGSMDSLIQNVVVLEAPDYLTRGWCLYEYIVSSLRGSTVCDEVQDERFVTLRDWANTPPPALASFRDSFQSQQQNYVNERILTAITNVLPLYGDAAFQTDADREVVTGLLVEHLKRALPPIKESQQYFGEWKTTRWTDELLTSLFSGEAEVPRLESGVAIKRFDTEVPSTLGEAVSRRYEIKRFGWTALLNPLDSLLRVSWRRE